MIAISSAYPLCKAISLIPSIYGWYLGTANHEYHSMHLYQKYIDVLLWLMDGPQRSRSHPPLAALQISQDPNHSLHLF